MPVTRAVKLQGWAKHPRLRPQGGPRGHWEGVSEHLGFPTTVSSPENSFNKATWKSPCPLTKGDCVTPKHRDGFSLHGGRAKEQDFPEDPTSRRSRRGEQIVQKYKESFSVLSHSSHLQQHLLSRVCLGAFNLHLAPELPADLPERTDLQV